MEEGDDQKPILSRCASAIPTAAPATDLPRGPADTLGSGSGGAVDVRSSPPPPAPPEALSCQFQEYLGSQYPDGSPPEAAEYLDRPAPGLCVSDSPRLRAPAASLCAPGFLPPSSAPSQPSRSAWAMQARGGCSAGPTSPGWPHLPAPGAEGPGSGLRHQRSRARAGSRLTAQRRRFTHSTDCSGSAAPIAPITAGAASSAGRGARGRRGARDR